VLQITEQESLLHTKPDEDPKAHRRDLQQHQLKALLVVRKVTLVHVHLTGALVHRHTVEKCWSNTTGRGEETN
jgi:hypothetical protein